MEYSEVYEYLIEIAKNRCKVQSTELNLSDKVDRKKLHEQKIIVTYGDVLVKFGEIPNNRNALNKLFEIIDQINEKTNPILLSALIVEGKQLKPGKGFFQTWLPKTKYEDKLSTWIKELDKIWQQYCK
ncbi:MAG: hypothetical protein Q7J10_04455 [Methanosarcinaceae archaeon]|nr:hypothetical protein [Methanosarcinaceae archaeon]